MEQYHGTTILSVRRGQRVAMGGDGQGAVVQHAAFLQLQRADVDGLERTVVVLAVIVVHVDFLRWVPAARGGRRLA